MLELSHLQTKTCGYATRLLATYEAALAAYDQVRYAAGRTTEHITIQEAVDARRDAHLVAVRARRAYWRHVEEHACRRLVVERTTSAVAGKVKIYL